MVGQVLAAAKDRVLNTIESFSNLTEPQRAEFKKKIQNADAVEHLEVLEKMASELNTKQGEQSVSPEQKPSHDDTSAGSQKPAKQSSEFGFSNVAKGLFGATAILGIFGIIFGGVAHAIKHFPGFEQVHNQVRDALAKIGIRF